MILRNDRCTVSVMCALSLLGLLGGLLAAEVLARIFTPHPRYPEFSIPEEHIGYIQKPGHRGRATNMFGEFDTAIRINREGFRDSDHPLVKPAGTLRIAFLGGSFTYAEQVEESRIFVRRVETLLNEKKTARGPRVECLNFGLGGFDGYQEVLCYETFVRKYRPDIVVLATFLHNDVSGNVFYLEGGRFGRPYFRLANGVLEKVPADPKVMKERYQDKRERFMDVKWYQHSQFYNTCRQLMWEMRQNRKRARLAKKVQQNGGDWVRSGHIWQEPVYNQYRYYAGDGSDPYIAEANAVTRLLLERLAAMTREDGAQLRAALLPAWENLWPERWPERQRLLPGIELFSLDFNRPFDLAIDAFNKLGIPQLDLRPPLRRADREQSIFFKRDNHYNGRGQEAVACEIAAWLEEVLQKPANKP